MLRITSSLAAILLCGTALAGCSTLESLNPFGADKPAAGRLALEQQVQENTPPTDLAGGVAMAHQLRLDGKYDEATRILSQLMLIASDDPRVVGEYGKTLLQRGRMQDAVQFLTRAGQLQPGDWSTWSALGVAYDQLGDQASARTAYDHALALAPNEPSVLSNYALSRLLAKDVDGARSLAARAASAGGAVDPRIARNIAMIEATSPPPAPQATASAQPANTAPAAAAQPVAAQPLPAAQPAPRPVPTAQLPAGKPAATAAPRILLPQTAASLPPGAQQYAAAVIQPIIAPKLAAAAAEMTMPAPARPASAAPALRLAADAGAP